MADPGARRGLQPALLGSLPGTDLGAALRLVIDETPEVMCLPELPARGVGAEMIGRTCATLSGLFVDLQPAGWRLTDHPGLDHRRAVALLRRDLDDLEEAAHQLTGVMKLAVSGPWTMAASLERPRGDRVLADHGARRDLAQSLAQGVGDLMAELGRRLPALQWWLQVDEPLLGHVLAGELGTASGLGKHRAVLDAEAIALLHPFSGLASTTALHWCGRPQWAVTQRSGFTATSIDIARLVEADLEGLSSWVESGRRVWWGALATEVPDQVAPLDRDVERLLTLLHRLGLDPTLLRGDLVTPACGLGTWQPLPALQVVRQTRRLAEIATEELFSQEGVGPAARLHSKPCASSPT